VECKTINAELPTTQEQQENAAVSIAQLGQKYHFAPVLCCLCFKCFLKSNAYKIFIHKNIFF